MGNNSSRSNNPFRNWTTATHSSTIPNGWRACSWTSARPHVRKTWTVTVKSKRLTWRSCWVPGGRARAVQPISTGTA